MIETLQKTPSEQFHLDEDVRLRHERRFAATLARIEMSDDEVERQFAGMVELCKQTHLPELVKNGEMDAYLKEVPTAKAFIKKVHDLANKVLEEKTLDNDSVSVIYDIGVASDVARDRTLLERTADKLDDTQDMNLISIKRALTTAIEEDELFIDTYRSIQAGKRAVQTVMVNVDHERINTFGPRDYATGALYPWERPTDWSTKTTNIDSFDELFDGEARSNPVVGQEFKLYEKPLDDDSHTFLSVADIKNFKD